VKILIVSDTHLTPLASAFGDNWKVLRTWAKTMAPDLVVHLGDITADGARDASEFDTARPLFGGIGEIRFLPGNHDIGDNPIAPGAPNKHPVDPARLADYRRVFDADHWSLDAGAWQLVGLDAQLFATGTDEEEQQFQWLEREMARRAGPVGVMLHKPLFRDGPDDAEAHVRYVPAEARRRLLALLAARDLRFVVSGHAHQARRLHVGGVEHVWAPSSAYCIPDAVQERIGEKTVGALVLELNDSDHRFQPVAPDGLMRHNILDHPDVYPELAEIRARLGPRTAL